MIQTDQTVTDLETLAEQCLSAARAVKAQLAAQKAEQPTWEQNSAFTWPTLEGDGEAARLQLRCASKALYELSSGPDEIVTSMQYAAIHDISALRYIQTYSVLDAIPTTQNATISYNDLATATGTNAGQLKQMLRHLMTSHVLHEPQLNHVAHTSTSLALLNKNIRAYNEWLVLDALSFVARLTDAVDKWGHGSQSPTETGLNLAWNTSKPMFPALEERPVTRQRFATLMTYAATNSVFSASHVSAYSWSSLPADAIIVDVGGSNGHCMIPILNVHPTATAIVQDLPNLISKAADPSTCVIPPSLRPRITFSPHNFYQPQPVRGASVYFFRMVMHIVSDALAANILRQTVAAMSPSSKIVIMDEILPAPGTVPNVIERGMRAQDCGMMLFSNARERDISQWKELFAAVDPRLEITTVIHPEGSAQGIIEVSLRDEVADRLKDINLKAD